MEAASIVRRLRATFETGRTRQLEWRTEQLRRLSTAIARHDEDIHACLREDLGKPEVEARLTETGAATREIDRALRHLRRWLLPERIPIPLALRPGASAVHLQPLGVVLIMAPWNYPFRLSILPLVGAIAAGNCAVVKPSELAPRTSAVVAQLLASALDADTFGVMEGGANEAEALLEQRFDHIFFTGSRIVGRTVMAVAARHPTPVTLELGGKNPCIVDGAPSAAIARRIAFAKFVNAGQSCVAPDYVLVRRDKEGAFLRELAKAIAGFYGPDPRASADYGRIGNPHHFAKLARLIGDGEVVVGGACVAAERYIAPTVLRNVGLGSELSTEEIFGPLLPVWTVADLDEAMARVNAQPEPLVTYLFTSSKQVRRAVLERTRSGALVVNDALVQLAVPDLPFGGVGASGMGAYHGRASLETFSQRRSVLTRRLFPDLAVRYPPYGEAKLTLLKMLF